MEQLGDSTLSQFDAVQSHNICLVCIHSNESASVLLQYSSCMSTVGIRCSEW